MVRRRLDLELVRRALFASRTEAQRAIQEGLVTVGGAPASSCSRMVDAGEPVVVLGPPARYVGRGGDKLAGALSHFDLDVSGRRALDAGASTGGFTDAMLQAGAAFVVAVDVGHGQLHPKIRNDERVKVFERTNVRDLSAEDIGGPVDLIVCDLSFISVKSVLDAFARCGRPGSEWMLLVKPQFEAGRSEVSKGKGVISDPAVHERVLNSVVDAVVSHGSAIIGTMTSPLKGADGNVEFFVYARRP